MNPVYSTILKQTGMSELKALVSKWQTLSETVSARPSHLPILLPDIFLISQSGSGRSHLVKLLADYLSYNEKLMDFYGDTKYFEFLLNYCEPKEYFTEIERLMIEVRNAAGFRNEYKGIIYIDIDEWVGHCEEKHFTDFLEYLSDNSDNWLVILSVSSRDDDKLEPMLSLVSAYLRVEPLTIEAPTVDELSAYLFDLLKAYGFTLEGSAKACLTKTVRLLCENTHFDGYKTVKRLAQDVVYSLYSRGITQAISIEDTHLNEFSLTSNYVARMLTKVKTNKKIGF